MITLPYNWTPRDYQLPLWNALETGAKRAVAVWHRRAGKDAVGVHWTTVAAVQRPGVYWHMLPTLAQARKVIWDGRTKEGAKTLDAWPQELISHRRNDEMKLELANGSIWQVVGSDNYDSLVGGNPVGVVFSEFPLTDPEAWNFIRPILAENGGWALFLYTPRGRNHGWELYNQAQKNEGWFSSLLTVEDTGAIPMEAVEDERRSGMQEEVIQQEFYCSFEAPLFGAYYAQEMLTAGQEGRIGKVAYDPSVPVETWWDLGIGDSTAIWFAQRVGQEIHLIDYYEDSGEALSHYVKYCQRKEYVYGDHVFPHDVRARELISGKTREETLRSLGMKPRVVTKHNVEDRIDAVRNMLGRCWFDEEKTARGVEALRQFRKEYDPKSKDFKSRPVHDWASHGADSFGYGAMHRPYKRNWKPLEYDNRWIL